MHPVRTLTRFLALAVLAGAVVAPAAAGPKAVRANWKGSGSGTTTPDPDRGVDVDEIVARSSILGRYTGEGFHVLNPADFTFAGQAVWTTASGDAVNVTYTGQVFPSGDPDYPYGFVAELVADGGTGRFAHAAGRAAMTGAFTGIPGQLRFEFEGTLHPQGR